MKTGLAGGGSFGSLNWHEMSILGCESVDEINAYLSHLEIDSLSSDDLEEAKTNAIESIREKKGDK